MMISEKSQSIMTFFSALTNVAINFNIYFTVNYVMIDAAPEEALAIRTFWPNAAILMCWFHLKKNVKEPKHAGNKDLKSIYNKILSECDYLHNSTNLQIFESRKAEVLTNWSLPIWAPNLYNALQIFKSYFIRQWLAGTFVNWQILNTPAGYSTTQNPEESFNNQIKLILI